MLDSVAFMTANDCAQRVMMGFGVGAALGGSIGAGRLLSTAQCSSAPSLRQPWHAGAVYGTYGAIKQRVSTAGAVGLSQQLLITSAMLMLLVPADTWAVQNSLCGTSNSSNRIGELLAASCSHCWDTHCPSAFTLVPCLIVMPCNSNPTTMRDCLNNK